MHRGGTRRAPLPVELGEREVSLRSGELHARGAVTDEGEIDLLGEVTGLGGYGDIVLQADEIDIHGARVRILSLEALRAIANKLRG